MLGQSGTHPLSVGTLASHLASGLGGVQSRWYTLTLTLTLTVTLTLTLTLTLTVTWVHITSHPIQTLNHSPNQASTLQHSSCTQHRWLGLGFGLGLGLGLGLG